MNYDIFIPIRLASKRLPNKALLTINDKPIIKYLIERLERVKKIRKIIVCTTNLKNDDDLVDFLHKENIEVFRGNEKDILQRYLDASTKYGTDFIINVDGDDIYTDPQTLDQIILNHLNSNADFIPIIDLPLGLLSFGFTTKSLKELCELKKTNNTETGWLRFFTETKIFHTKNVILTLKNKFPSNIRLSLDYPEDFEIAKVIFTHLGNDFDLEKLSLFLNNNPNLLKKIQKTNELWKNHYQSQLADISLKNHTTR